jgi:uncharacterized protein YjbI with pentapeptide repeats
LDRALDDGVDDGIDDGASYQDQRFHKLDLAGRRLVGTGFYDCQFESCAFTESVFQGCRFVGCTFKECNLSLVQLPGSAFSATRFFDSRIIGVDWTQADWSGISLGQPIGFERCALSHSTFIGLSLPGIQVKDCLAADVDFREADLSRADFSDSDLEQSLFANTDLNKADLRTARNYRIAPGKNVLTGARFALPEAMSLLYNLDIDLSEGK